MEEKESGASVVEQGQGVSQQIAKKTNKNLIVIVVALAVFGGIGYTANNYLAKKAGEKTAEKILEGVTGGDVDINDDGTTFSNESGSIATGDSAKWPSDMPSEVPIFKYGTVAYTTVSKTEYRSWFVSLQNVETGAFDNYKKELIDKGWVETSTSTYGDASIAVMEKGETTLSFSTSTSESTATIAVNYSS